MVVTVDVRIPSDSLDEEAAVELPSDATVWFDRMVPRGRTESVPFVWVRTDDFEGFERTMRAQSGVRDAECLDDQGEWRLYRVDWTPHERLGDAIDRTDAAVLDWSIDERGYLLRLRFPDDESVSRFGDLCDQRGVTMVPLRINRRADRPGESGLTPQQRTTLRTAYRLGYFDVPRQATLEDIAAEFGVSDQAVSERLRRGMTHLVEKGVLGTSEFGGDADDDRYWAKKKR